MISIGAIAFGLALEFIALPCAGGYEHMKVIAASQVGQYGAVMIYYNVISKIKTQ